MKKLLLATTSVAVMSLAASAHAGGSNEPYTATNNASVAKTDNNPQYAWYLSVLGLANFLEDGDASIGAVAGQEKYDTGWGVLAAAGRQVNFGPLVGMRGELELGYRHNSADSFSAGTGASAAGSVEAYTAMANIYYDMVNSSRFTPYIGAGIGGIYAQTDGLRAPGVIGYNDDQDFGLAYQGIAGVSYAIDQNWSAMVEYRYLGTSNLNMQSSVAAASDNFDYDSHNALAGLTYKFY